MNHSRPIKQQIKKNYITQFNIIGHRNTSQILILPFQNKFSYLIILVFFAFNKCFNFFFIKAALMEAIKKKGKILY